MKHTSYPPLIFVQGRGRELERRLAAVRYSVRSSASSRSTQWYPAARPCGRPLRIVAGDQNAALKALRDLADIIFLALERVNLALEDLLAAALHADIRAAHELCRW